MAGYHYTAGQNHWRMGPPAPRYAAMPFISQRTEVLPPQPPPRPPPPSIPLPHPPMHIPKMQTHRAVAPHRLTLDQSATHMLGTNLASLDEIFKHVALMDYDVPGTSLEDLVSLVTQQVEAVRKDSTE